MPLEIVRNDITKMSVDAIVNAANKQLQQGGGVCGAIFAAAGADALQAECNKIGHCDIGHAVITEGYALPAKHVIHTVGPIWHGGTQQEEVLLFSSYTNALHLALEKDFGSIAFPLISSGIFGYPKGKALQVAISAIGSFLLQHDMLVYLVVYDKAAYSLSDKLFNSIKTYIDDNYVDEHIFFRSYNEVHPAFHQDQNRYLLRNGEPEADYQSAYFEESRIQASAEAPAEASAVTAAPSEATATASATAEAPAVTAAPKHLDKVLNHLGETFTEMLLRLVDEGGQTDPVIYKKANLDRKLFSKIRSNSKYKPSKNTALALAVALELNLDKTTDLLRSAGYALSPSSRFDLIVSYFVDKGIYNIFEINEALFAFDESLLGV